MRPYLLVTLLAACAAPVGPAHDPLPADLAPPTAPVLTLEATAILPGQPATFTVGGLGPSEPAYVLRSPALSSQGPCPPIVGGLCLDIASPISSLGSATADASGTATLTVTVPAGAPLGLNLAFQAVSIRGAHGSASVKSPALARQVGTPLSAPITDLVEGDLVVTEILQDPTAVADAVGEWFEVYNASGLTVDLQGLEVSDLDGDTFSVTPHLVVAPGGLVVFGANDDPAVNGGVDVDHAWTGFTLANGEDEIILGHGGLLFDAVAWDDGLTFPDPSGHSMSLDPSAWTATDNDDGGLWCASSASGTPGAANEACPLPACGDGHLDPTEACDDGGLVAGDGCDASCQLEGCPVAEIERGHWTVATGLEGATARFAADGSVMVTGTHVTGTFDAITGARLAPGTWTTLWSTEASLSTDIDRRVVVAGPSGGGYLVGDFNYGGYYRQDGLINQVDAAGSITWTERIQASHWWFEYVRDAIATRDGGVLVVGNAEEPTYEEETYGFAIKYDAAGNIVWDYGVEGEVYGWAEYTTAIELANGDFLLIGKSNPDLGPDAAVAVRIRATGTVVWDVTLESSGSVWINDAAEAPNGDLLLVGERYGSPNRPLAAVLSSTGGLAWSRVLDYPTTTTVGSRYDVAEVWPAACPSGVSPGGACADPGQICATSTVNQVCSCDEAGSWSCATSGWSYLAAGTFGDHLGTPDIDFTAMAFSPAGAVGWARAWGGTAHEFVTDMRVASHGELQLVGSSGTAGAVRITSTDSALHAGCDELELSATASSGGISLSSVLLHDWTFIDTSYSATRGTAGTATPTTVCASTVCP